jgi:hypothetical protein
MTYTEYKAKQAELIELLAAANVALATQETADGSRSSNAYLQAKRARNDLECAKIAHIGEHPRLRVTRPDGRAVVGGFGALEEVLLRINGGGYTERQTVQAMQDAQAVRDGHTVRHAGWVVESVPALPVEPAPLHSPVAITVGATS